MIYVTDYMLDRHRELIPVYERLGKTEYAEKEKRRLRTLTDLRRRQDNKPIQLSLW